MAWQDTAITISIFALSYALIPQILLAHKRKKSLISLQAAAITIIGMISLAVTYLTLNFALSSIMAFVSATLWAILLVQSKIYKK
jgi:hypothetical protein